MSADAAPELPDSLLLCYCTHLTMDELRQACRGRTWPPAGKEQTGKLCTGCLGDLLYCLGRLGADDLGHLASS